MRKALRILTALVMVSILLLGIVACSKSATNENAPAASETGKAESTPAETTKEEVKKEVTLSWLTSQAKFDEVYKNIAEQIKADENITVDFQVMPDDQFYTLVKTKLATNEVPDIIEYNFPNGEFDVVKYCEELSGEPWVKRLVSEAYVNKSAVDKIDGKIYCMPRNTPMCVSGIYYNKKVFSDLGINDPNPQTWDEFLKLCETIKTKGNGIVPVYTAEKDSWTTQCWITTGLSLYMYPNEAAVYGDLLANKKKFADVPEFNKVLTDLQSLFKNGYTNKDHLTASFDMQIEAIGTGKAAMIWGFEYSVDNITAKYPEAQIDSFAQPNNVNVLSNSAFLQGMYIPKESKNVIDAKRLLNAWSQPKNLGLYYAKKPGIAPFKDIDGGEIHPALKKLFDKYIATGKVTPQMNDYMGIIGPIYSQVWQEYVAVTTLTKSPEDAIKSIDKIYSEFMKSKEQPGF